MIGISRRFLPHVVSPKRAQGLMQLMPETAARFGVSDPFDPDANIDGGVRYPAASPCGFQTLLGPL